MTKDSEDPLNKDKAIDVSGDFPCPELDLKRSKAVGERGTTVNGDRNVPKHSNISALSRYNSSVASSKVLSGYGGICSHPLGKRSEIVNLESTNDPLLISKATPLYHISDGNTSNGVINSTAKNAFTMAETSAKKLVVIPAAKDIHPPALHFIPHQTDSWAQGEHKIRSANGSHHMIQVHHHHHHHHHYHHHHHLAHNIPRQHQSWHPPDHNKPPLNNVAAIAPQCGSSNVIHGDHGSDGINRGGAAVNTEGAKLESDIEGGNGVDHNGLTRRADALNKF